MFTIWKVIEGLQILSKYGGKKVQAEQDVLYAGVDIKPSTISESDVKRLSELGWDWYTEYESWRMFV